MQPMKVLAMKGTTSPVQYGMPSLMKMASSMQATRITGMERDRKTMATRIRMAMMDIQLVQAKSWLAVS